MLSMFHSMLDIESLIYGPITHYILLMLSVSIWHLTTARDSQQTGTSLSQAACVCACVVSILDGVLGPDSELTWPH